MKYFSSLKILKSGQVRKIFDAKTGRRLRALNDLESGQNLILSAFDPLKKVPYKLIDFSGAVTTVKKEPEVFVSLISAIESCKILSKWGFLSYWIDLDHKFSSFSRFEEGIV